MFSQRNYGIIKTKQNMTSYINSKFQKQYEVNFGYSKIRYHVAYQFIKKHVFAVEVYPT